MEANYDISSRLKEVRKFLGLNQTDFSSKIGIKQNHLSSIENGHYSLNISVLKILIEDFNVNINWLLSGKGSMFYEGEGKIEIDDIIKKLEEYKKQEQEG